jgi:DNA topoisomerase-1
MPAEVRIGDVEQKAIDDLGLRRIDTGELNIDRISRANAVIFLRDGKRPVGRRDLKRIAELAIPPAWSEVRIASDGNAHLQAVGRDEAGRLQYIYHNAWDDVRAAAKAFRLRQLGQALSDIRAAIDRDLKNGGARLPLAAAARLVDLFHLRAGHECYAGDEGGRGVATLLKRHVRMDGATFRLSFRGKGGKRIEKTHTDDEFAEVLAELRRWRGSRLFKLRSELGYRPMTATNLNAYLSEVSERPITAKDFRTFHASATALDHFVQIGPLESQRARRGAIAEVCRLISADLANTSTVTRRSYIHSRIIEKFENSEIFELSSFDVRTGLTQAESRLMRFLEMDSG